MRGIRGVMNGSDASAPASAPAAAAAAAAAVELPRPAPVAAAAAAKEEDAELLFMPAAETASAPDPRLANTSADTGEA
jgi:hypothetical protein